MRALYLSRAGLLTYCRDVQILNTLNVPYETVNILEDERLRSGMKEFSQWPTFPQVYINGEFYGGCDIMIGENHSSRTWLRNHIYIYIYKYTDCSL